MNKQVLLYRRELSKSDLEKLSRFFREDFGYVYSLSKELSDIEKQIIELTEKQKEAKILNDNCRNTKQISYQNELLTGIEQAKNEVIYGQDVRNIKYKDNEGQRREIKEIINY